MAKQVSTGSSEEKYERLQEWESKTGRSAAGSRRSGGKKYSGGGTDAPF